MKYNENVADCWQYYSEMNERDKARADIFFDEIIDGFVDMTEEEKDRAIEHYHWRQEVNAYWIATRF